MKKVNASEENQSSGLVKINQFQAPTNMSLKPILKHKRSKKLIIPDSSWLSDASLYPEGWRYKMCKNKTNVRNRTNIKFLLPNGTVICGMIPALAYMIQNGYPLEDLKMMRKALGQRGWSEDASLPENWIFRRTTSNSQFKTLQFCDSLGNFFPSREKAIKFVVDSIF